VTETVPADIAAAIDKLASAAKAHGAASISERPATCRVYLQASTALNAVILHHLRAHAEMKAALERIEQGV
jgi:hypothetical protein